VDLSPDRPTNEKFRDNLTGALRIEGVPNSELKVKGNLVWWEKDVEKEASSNWRT
jgi:hypothetical protein